MITTKTIEQGSMTNEENLLWKKISSFNPDDETSSFKFSARLARENGWTISYANNVIEEYKKFLFLCCITSSGVTPSDQVDQAWHLHLTYTKSYWTDLCKNILPKEIHHNPTKGGHLESKKFNSYYTDTLNQYRGKFGTEPPESIWPDNEKRFSDIDFQRVNMKNYWLIRRPELDKKRIMLFTIIFLALFFIQFKSSSNLESIIIGIIFLISVLSAIFSKNKGNGNSSGGGCAGGSCGHSGCSGCSGCGGGCEGCGGCGG